MSHSIITVVHFIVTLQQLLIAGNSSALCLRSKPDDGRPFWDRFFNDGEGKDDDGGRLCVSDDNGCEGEEEYKGDENESKNENDSENEKLISAFDVVFQNGGSNGGFFEERDIKSLQRTVKAFHSGALHILAITGSFREAVQNFTRYYSDDSTDGHYLRTIISFLDDRFTLTIKKGCYDLEEDVIYSQDERYDGPGDCIRTDGREPVVSFFMVLLSSHHFLARREKGEWVDYDVKVDPDTLKITDVSIEKVYLSDLGTAAGPYIDICNWFAPENVRKRESGDVSTSSSAEYEEG